MKSTQHADPVFRPVLVTLETQQEVDALYAFLTHAKLSNPVGLIDQHDELRPFSTDRYLYYFNILDGLLK